MGVLFCLNPLGVWADRWQGSGLSARVLKVAYSGVLYGFR